MAITITPEQSVASIVEARPQVSELFERLGIDTCCGGQATLAEQCDRLRLDVGEVLRAIGGEAGGGPNPAAPGVRGVCDHLEQVQYDAARILMARALELGERVAAVHGRRRPELAELARTLRMFVDGVESHFDEMSSGLLVAARGGSAKAGEEAARATEAQRALERLLVRMRQLSGGFTAPEEACGSWRQFVLVLGELEAATRSWIRMERDVLFPITLGMRSSTAVGVR